MEKINEQTINYSEAEKLYWKRKNCLSLMQKEKLTADNFFIHALILTTLPAGDKKEKKEKVVAKRLTGKEKAAITAATKREVKALNAGPLPPYEIIIPAPGMGHLNAAELCTMTAPLFITIVAIKEFQDANPPVSDCSDLYDLLFPLSNIGRKISDSDKKKRDVLVRQLRNKFLSCLKSCALLADGNMALYLLIGSPVKRKGTRSGKDLKACEFKLHLNSGRGKVKLTCLEIAGAKGYLIRWGTGVYNPLTWSTQSGGATQIVSSNFLPGDYINFVMIAFKGDGSEGDIANIQGCNIPYS